MPRKVLSVGQCGADQGNITRTLTKAFDVEVIGVDSAAEALTLARQGGFALVLVNRIFDADGDSGLDLIRQFRADSSLAALPVLLVSNYEDAQAEAIAAGAVPGFGKASLGQPAMLARVRAFLSD
jgi:CheY-like chemotaxis protein